MWDFIKVLFPTMIVHLAASLLIVTTIWFLLKKTNHATHFHLVALLLFAGGASIWHSMSTLVELNQNQKLQEWQQVRQQEQAAAALAASPNNNLNLTPGSPEEAKVRQEYLKVIDQIMSNPQQLNEQVRQKIFESFQGVYRNPKMQQFYKTNLANFVLCSRAYVKDAYDTLSQKKEVRSKDQEECSKITGEFFNRPKLLDDNFVNTYGANNRKPASRKGTLKPEELKALLERQEIAVKIISYLFPEQS